MFFYLMYSWVFENNNNNRAHTMYDTLDFTMAFPFRFSAHYCLSETDAPEHHIIISLVHSVPLTAGIHLLSITIERKMVNPRKYS